MPTIAYTGCRTTTKRNARGQGIEVFLLERDGSWIHQQSMPNLVNPSYLLVDQERLRLFCVHGDESEVSAFRIDRADGSLTYVNTQSTHGLNPVHLCLTQSGTELVVANYASGTAVALPVLTDDSLAPVVSILQFTGAPGPNAVEQRGPHPHQVLRLAGTDWFIFPDKGTDTIWFAEFDSIRKAWRQNSVRRIAARPGAGPRHGVVHPSRQLLYIVNELDSTLATYQLNESDCNLIDLAELLPTGFDGHNQAAGIALDPTGQWLFVSNRGHETLSTLAIAPENGLPQVTGWVPCAGRTPRFITLCPDHPSLVVAHEGSHTIHTYPINEAAFRSPLGPSRQVVSTGSPTCAAFATI
ncbi:beta-propeller fold lactonase family protein [Cupriavidus sp. SW-Y-13]|uniref:lactonase family protein n=1 Tax=Cupriavidus sp. SW-Y-13 TaxID=2653854 RepID=UPI001366291D|nr:beta-propeller fold lactonase family protein [Cupriavidus sp. SW-Y-13]MWL89667.1 beta-propeller fold lactonase family protein [Cupriavidus sp. SW-Y-13]